MKRLVTESDLRRLARGAKLLVDRETLVTPAARDYALLAGIELYESSRVGAAKTAANAPAMAAKPCCDACAEGKSCAAGTSCAASPAASAAGALAALGEGDWLVQVRAGKATVRRVAP